MIAEKGWSLYLIEGSYIISSGGTTFTAEALGRTAQEAVNDVRRRYKNATIYTVYKRVNSWK